jgi:hypothetical protein
MAEVLQGYFMHPEAKPATPQGMGPLPRRHVAVERVVAIGKESNRLALMQAEETYGTIGGDTMAGSIVYGVTGTQDTLASLFAEDIVDQMAATCLPRSTLYAVRHGPGTQSAQTLAALQEGMRLLDPGHAPSLAGWRETLPTAEALAQVLGCQLDRARALRVGKTRWQPEERARLMAQMVARGA